MGACRLWCNNNKRLPIHALHAHLTSVDRMIESMTLLFYFGGFCMYEQYYFHVFCE